MRLGYSDDYKYVFSEIHRHGVSPCYPPAATWHLSAYIQQDGDQDSGSLELKAERAKINEARDGALAHIKRLINAALQKCVPPENIPGDLFVDAMPPKPGSSTAIDNFHRSFIFLCDGVSITMDVGLHSDHYTATFLIDERPAHARVGARTWQPIDGLAKKFTNSVKTLGEAAERVAEARKLDTAEGREALKIDLSNPGFRSAQQFLTSEIWTQLSAFLSVDDRPFAGAFLENVCADLRGVLLTEEGTGHRSPQEALLPSLPPTMARYHSDDIAAKGIDKLWPLFALESGGDPGREFVACRVLRKNALYLSSLRSPNRDAAPGEQEHVQYAILSTQPEAWQMGQLVNRFHALGTLRLLALRGLRELRTASVDIRAAGSHLDKIFVRLLSGNGSVSNNDIRNWFQEYASINKKVPDGGLAFRVERSRNIARQFELLIDDLSIDRIETWEPYDQFVRRRISDVYEHIAETRRTSGENEIARNGPVGR